MIATNAQHFAQLSQGRSIMRYFIAALGLVVALGFSQVASAADGWGTQNNGYGQYHVSNG